jgi:uncharacterized membrane-anchored protein
MHAFDMKICATTLGETAGDFIFNDIKYWLCIDFTILVGFSTLLFSIANCMLHKPMLYCQYFKQMLHS